MSAKVFVVRHGETEWSKNQQHTGTTEVPLTSNGERQVKMTASTFVGNGKLVQPKKIRKVFCSPRGRARHTLDLLQLGVDSKSPSSTSQPALEITDLLQEWNYGDYEGLTIAQVRELRASKGLDKDRPWNIWRDGCPGGESPQQVSARLDKLISQIKQTIRHEGETAMDAVCVAHGHILSALALRWADQPLEHGMRLLIETGGVGTLCFEHSSTEEPAVMLGARPE